MTWYLDLRAEIVLPSDGLGRLFGRDNRGPRLEARLCRYQSVGEGMAAIPVVWSGF